MFRKKAVGQIHQMSGEDGAVVIRVQSHRRIQDLRGLDPHQIPILFLKELNPGMRERLKRRAEPILHLARAVGDSSNLAVLSAEERHNPVCLAQRIGF